MALGYGCRPVYRKKVLEFMENLIALVLLALLVGGAVFYLIRARRRGVRCVGCPACGECCSGKKQNKET